jgi:hypothetical protein
MGPPVLETRAGLKRRKGVSGHRPLPGAGCGGYAPDPIWKNEKNPAIEIKFPISLSIASMPEDKRSAR